MYDFVPFMNNYTHMKTKIQSIFATMKPTKSLNF